MPREGLMLIQLGEVSHSAPPPPPGPAPQSMAGPSRGDTARAVLEEVQRAKARRMLDRSEEA